MFIYKVKWSRADSINMRHNWSIHTPILAAKASLHSPSPAPSSHDHPLSSSAQCYSVRFSPVELSFSSVCPTFANKKINLKTYFNIKVDSRCKRKRANGWGRGRGVWGAPTGQNRHKACNILIRLKWKCRNSFFFALKKREKRCAKIAGKERELSSFSSSTFSLSSLYILLFVKINCWSFDCPT